MQGRTWINGEPLNALSVHNRGLNYGDGFFETMRVHKGTIPLWALHFQRIKDSIARLFLSCDLAQLDDELKQFLKTVAPESIIKIILTRGEGGRGYYPDPHLQATRILSEYALQLSPQEYMLQGINVGLCQLKLAQQPLLAGLKHLNRLEQVFLRKELEAMNCPEAFVCDNAGLVIEGVFHNVFFVKNEKVYTPALTSSGIAGVGRQFMLDICAAQNIPVFIGDFKLADFLSAEEVFMVNSVQGIWPVLSYNSQHWQKGKMTQQLQFAWQEVFS